MKKLKLFFSLLFALMMGNQLVLSQSFTVPTCSSTVTSVTYGPMYNNTAGTGKNRTAFILTAAQLAGIDGGTITSTYFKRNSATGTLANANFKIYLKNYPTASFGTGSLDWATAITGATLVYDSNPSTAAGTDAGWKEFDDTTSADFLYTATTGNDNLAVFLEYEQQASQASVINFDYEYTSPCVNTGDSNTTKYNNSTTALATTLSSSNFRRPVIGFDVTFPPATSAPACTNVTSPADGALDVSVLPTLSWTPLLGQNGASDYKINMGTAPGLTDVLNGVSSGGSSSYTLTTPLNYNTAYYVTIVPENNIGSTTGCTETVFVTGNIPCPTVTSPTAGQIGVSTTPTITWNAVPGATEYYITMGTSAGATDVLNYQSVGNVLTYTLPTALPYSTQFFYTVFASDGTSPSTSCTERNFTTVCDAFVPNYTNDFSTFPGNCWSRASGGDPATGPGTGTTNYWVTDGFLNNTTTGAARINLYSTNRKGWLISPAFDLSSGGYRVKFDYGVTTYSGTAAVPAMGSDDIVQVLVSPDGGTTWTVLQTWDTTNTPSNSSNQYIYNLTAYTGTNTIFAVYGSDGTVDDSPDYNFYVDNFVVETIPSCSEPTGLMVDSYTSNSANLSWTAPTTPPANGYQIYYDTTNTAPTAGSTPNGGTFTTNSAIISSLVADTTYYIWVRSDCGSGQSIWAGPVMVYTGYCLPAPSSVDGVGITNVTFGNNPNIVNNTTTDEPNHYGDYSSMIGDLPAGVASQVAITYETGYVYNTKIWVDLNNDLLFDDATELLYTGASTSSNPTTLNASITIPAATPVGNYRMRIGGVWSGQPTPCYTGTYGTFEDYTVNVTAAPSCLPPTNLSTVTVSAFTADISWDPSVSTPGSYEVYYSTSNTAPTATTPLDATNSITSTTTTGTLSGLSATTTYYVWVRSVCSASDKSDWSTMLTFTTACAAQVPSVGNNYTNDFSTAPGNCWVRASGGDATTGPTGTTSYWREVAYLAGSGTGAMAYNFYSTGREGWLISPEFDLSPAATTKTLSFEYGLTAYNSATPFAGMVSDDRLEVLMSIDGGTTWTILSTLNSTSTFASGTNTYIYDLSSVTSNQVVFALYGNDGAVDTTDDYDFNVDNFTVTSDATLGTSEVIRDAKEVKVYPNPFTDYINISDARDLKSVSVIDMSGRVVKTIEKPSSKINLSGLASGMYILTLNYQDTVKTVKVIKK